MQKFGLALLFTMPMVSLADTVHFASASISSEDSIGIGYTAVIDGKYAVGLSHSDATDDIGVTAGGLHYGFQSFDTGTVYFGLGIADVAGSSETISTNLYDIEVDTGGTSVSAQLGYAKLSGEGLDYSFSLVTVDGDSSVSASMRQPIEDSDWGWLLGIATNGDEAAVSAGVSLTF
jgi:hypothetical protein